LPPVDWDERFDAMVERRTREAIEATIAPFVTERDRSGDRVAAIGNGWSRSMFGGLFYVSASASDDLPAANLVFVQSRDGNTVTANPSVLGGGEADRHLIYEGLSRVACDAVLGGARSIRGNDLVLSIWRPELVALRAAMDLSRHPAQVVATQMGLPLEEFLMFNVPELRVILITAVRGADAMGDALKARPWITSIVIDDAQGLADAFRELRRLGIERLSCIGGRTLATSLLDAGLVQDVYLTTGKETGGVPNSPMYDKPLQGREVVRKNGTGPDAGVIFEHLSLVDESSDFRGQISDWLLDGRI
jgi:riboflavin biosynthesis pyrimidine reductase